MIMLYNLCIYTSHLCEYGGGEVDDGIDSGQLLEDEDECAQDNALGGQ